MNGTVTISIDDFERLKDEAKKAAEESAQLRFDVIEVYGSEAYGELHDTAERKREQKHRSNLHELFTRGRL